MRLLDAITASALPYHGRGCQMRLVLDGLGEEDAYDVRQALSMSNVTASAISRALDARGVRIPVYTIRRHRRGECTCP